MLIAASAGAPDAAAQSPVAEPAPSRTAATAPSPGAPPPGSGVPDAGVPAPHMAPRVIGSPRTVATVESDTLLDVAYENDLGFVEVVAANPTVDPWLPGDGTRITLPSQHILPDAPHEGIVINLAEMRLYYFPPDDGMVRTYPVGIGRRGLSTPTGTTAVRAKVPEPTWYPTKRMRREDPSLPAAVPAGPKNPLGDYALDLGWPAYLIHGTNMKWGIGRRISSGCIRLYPADIEDLFNRVSSGTKVTVVDQPIKFAWAGGHLYVEAHTTQTQAEALEQTGAFQPDPDLKLTKLVRDALGDRRVAIDVERLKAAVARRRGLPVRITQRGAS